MGSACSRRRKAVNLLPNEDGCYIASGHQWGLRIVCISDTHGFHQKLGEIPEGDVLIHAGDFTLFGKEDHIRDFNDWLGSLPRKTKLVTMGNHENNANWHRRAAELLTNATLLRNARFELPVVLEQRTTTGTSASSRSSVVFYGADFYWPCQGANPYFENIQSDVDVLIAHGPAKGFADGEKGCEALRNTVERIRPTLVVSGHIHFAYGVACLNYCGDVSTLFVNAANCGGGKEERQIVHPPVVVDI